MDVYPFTTLDREPRWGYSVAPKPTWGIQFNYFWCNATLKF